jgi:dienelactone hydrolase
MRRYGVMLMTGILAAQAHAKIVTENVPYQHGDVALEGYLAYDDAVKDKRPGVLVVHEWWGLNDFAKQKAREVAELGYVAFAVDMYGKGVVTEDPEQAGKLAGQFRGNNQLWRERAKAAYDVLAKNPRVDASKIAAIGFCFGGSTVIQLAASGADLAGIVSFHGGLMPLTEDDVKRIKAKMLILHGAADAHVPDEAVKAFEDSLRKGNVDWQLIVYSGAKHAFMNPDADKLGMEGIGYQKQAAERAWREMREFFREIFGEQRPPGGTS